MKALNGVQLLFCYLVLRQKNHMPATHAAQYSSILHPEGFGSNVEACVTQLDHACGHEQQHAGEELQAVGEPGQTQRPAEGGVNIGQTLGPHQPLRLSQGLVRVNDVEGHATQGQQTWRDTSHTHIHRKKRVKSVLSLSWPSVH